MILPNNLTSNITEKKQTNKLTGNQKRHQLFQDKNLINYKTHIESEAGVYAIQCLDCNKNMRVKLPINTHE